jgi:hypothetical protein
MGRLTIAGSLILIATIGVSLAAIRESSLVWAAVVPLCVSAFFAYAAAMAVLRRDRRSAWIALIGLGLPYFVASILLTPWIGPIPVITPLIDQGSTRLDPPPPPMSEFLNRKEWMKLPVELRKPHVIKMNLESERDRQYQLSLESRRAASRVIAHSYLSLILGGMAALVPGLLALIQPSRPRLQES